MTTTRDEVDAVTYEQRRRVAALVRADEVDAVTRRPGRYLLGGVFLAILLAAVGGVLGLVGAGPSTPLPRSGVVVVADTGDRYVVRNGVLHPALNLVSALLAAGPQLTTVAASALDGRPLGAPIGIPGAPDTRPDRLVRGEWRVCSTAGGTSLAVGVQLDPPPADAGSVVRDELGRTWLAAGGGRHAVDLATASVLGLDSAALARVPAGVLAVLPEQSPLELPSVPGVGGPPLVAMPFPTVVGDVVDAEVAGGRHTYFVVLVDGLAPVSALAYAILAAEASHRVTVTAGPATAVLSATPAPVPADWPDTLPDLDPAHAARPLCAGGGVPSVSRPPTLPFTTGSRSGSGRPSVALPPRSATLLRSSDGRLHLLTEAGVAYPVSDAEAVRRLGYPTEEALDVPPAVVALLPVGPELSVTAGSATYPGPGPTASP